MDNSLAISENMRYYQNMQNHPITPIELELRKIGLSEKEARIYLVLLELGNIPIQEIAQKVNLSRPTVYRILDDLQEKGLITKEKKKQVRYVAANSPDELLGILRASKRKIEEQEREFLRIISILQTKYYSGGENEIRNYSGEEGKKLLLEDFSNTQSGEILVMCPPDDPTNYKELETIYKNIRKRLGKIEIKEIYPKETTEASLGFIKRKTAPAISKICAETLIISDKAISLKKNKGFVIEHEATISLIRGLFNAIWSQK